MLDENAQSDSNNEINHPLTKADRAGMSEIEWANQFFLTQIYDERFNPDGIEVDTDSNNCGPASLAMLMNQRDGKPLSISPEVAIDHARAMMHLGYPNIDPTTLSEKATLYMRDNLVLVDDDTQPVFFDKMAHAPSVAQGIISSGSHPLFAYSWNGLNELLNMTGAIIAHGFITEDWRAQFSSHYGQINPGAIPHFIAILSSTSPNQFIVCDPMHRRGAVLMTRSELMVFFRSPINVFDSTIKVVTWGEEYDNQD